MKDHCNFSIAARGKFFRNDAIEKLRVDIEAAWQQVEEGRVSDFDPATIKRRGREKLVKMRNNKSP